MFVLAEEDRALGRLSAEQTAAIVDGTDEVLDFLAEASDEEARRSAEAADPVAARAASLHCVGGRGEVDDAAAAVIAFALRQRGFEAEDSPARQPIEATAEGAAGACWWCAIPPTRPRRCCATTGASCTPDTSGRQGMW